MLLDKLIDGDNEIFLALLRVQPRSFEVSRHQNSAEVRSQPSLASLDCESVFTGGRAPVVGVVSLLRCRTKARGIKRKSPHRAGVSEFLAAGVSSHYFSSPDSSLRGPTGAAVMDRYIHRGITGMKKEENHLKGSSSSIIFLLHRDYSHTEPKGKHTRLINHTYCCTHLNVHFSVQFGLCNNAQFALK